MNQAFGKIVIKGRVDKGITQRQLAKKIGCSDVIVGQWERGLKSPGIDKVFEIEKALNVGILTKEFMDKMGGND